MFSPKYVDTHTIPVSFQEHLKKHSSPNTAAETVLAATFSDQHSETETSVKHFCLNS